MADRWHEVEQALDRAMELDLEARDAFVDGLDDAVAGEVRELLAAARLAGPLDGSGGDLATLISGALEEREAGQEVVGTRIGAYRIVEPLGRGGMGRVFVGEQVDGGFERRVAIKLLRWELAGPELRERFSRERRILARLEHPGIARLIDGGVTDDGVPFLVMELVEGCDIGEFAERRMLSVAERLELFCRVCDAIDFAHRHLVIHRDLKPSNIVVTEDGRIKLLDFGVAKLLDDATEGTLTGGAVAPMTPYFASPEQLLGQPLTTTSDVFSLGVLLYVLLTGETPFVSTGETITASELLRRVTEDQPTAPSASCPPERVSVLRGDIDAIALTAIRRDPTRRYPSAAALAEDVRRHLSHQPVEARGDSIPYRLGRFMRRHRWPVAATVLVVVALAAGLATTLWQSRRAEAARALAEQQSERAQDISQMVIDLFEVAGPQTSPSETITARQLLDAGMLEAREELAAQPAALAEMLVVIGEGYANLGLNEEANKAFEEAIALWNGAAANDPGALADALRRSGHVLLDHGQPERALGQYDAALAALATVRETGEETAELFRSRAFALLRLERAAEALQSVEEGIDRLESAGGASDAAWLVARGTRAMIFRATGRNEEAEQEYESILESQKELRVAGEELASTHNNLGYLLRVANRLEEAETHYLESLDLLNAARGETHPTTLRARSNLQVLLFMQGRIDDCETMMLETIELVRRDYADAHWRVGAAWRALGFMYLQAERDDAAAAAMAEAADNYSRALSPDNPWTLTTQLARELAIDPESAAFERARRALVARRSDLRSSDRGVLKRLAEIAQERGLAGSEQILSILEEE